MRLEVLIIIPCTLLPRLASAFLLGLALTRFAATETASERLRRDCFRHDCIHALSWPAVVAAADAALAATEDSRGKECHEDIRLIHEGYSRIVQSWKLPENASTTTDFDRRVVLAMLDSSGKLGAGILRGARMLGGNFEKCKSIDYKITQRTQHFAGSYYRLHLDAALRDHGDPGACAVDKGHSLLAKSSFISLDICLPASCCSTTLNAALGPGSKASLQQPNSSKWNPVCEVIGVNDTQWEPNASYFITSIILSSIAFVCILCGIIDFFAEPYFFAAKCLPWRLVTSFSAYRNISSIFDVNSFGQSDQLIPIHCLRFFSLCWVISGHTLSLYARLVSNSSELLATSKDFMTGFLTNSFFAADSFFFLSGFLLSFVWINHLKKNPRQMFSIRAWLLFYLHRFLRLSPAFYSAAFFSAFIVDRHWLRDMPLLMDVLPSFLSSTSSWWPSPLYVSNFVHWNSLCFSPGVYLAAEMQMFFFSPLLLAPLASKPRAGVFLAVLLVVMSTAAHVFTVFHFHWPASALDLGPHDPEARNMEEYGLWLHTAPYIRCQTYVMGILAGWFMRSRKTIAIHWIINLVCWLLSFCLMLTVVLGLYSHNNGLYVSVFWRAAYSSLSRPAWGLALAWIIISCYYGYGGIVNAWISWWIWVPLGRLSFCGILIHIPLIEYLTGLTTEANLHFSSFSELFVTRILPYCGLTFFFSIFWSAFYELSFKKIKTIIYDELGKK